MLWFWFLLRSLVAPVLYLGWWPRVSGLRNVPRTGAALLASNHQSIADHFFTAVPVNRRIFFIAKNQYVLRPGPVGLLWRAFFTGLGIVPVDRGGGRAAEAAITTGLRLLGEGKLLGIYPEGTRAPDTRLYKGRTGVARLALGARVPVIPVAVRDTAKVLPEGSIRPRLGVRPTVVFGEPLDFSRYHGQEHIPAVRREVTDEIMRAIQRLSGQEYVDRYATSLKSRTNPPATTPTPR